MTVMGTLNRWRWSRRENTLTHRYYDTLRVKQFFSQEAWSLSLFRRFVYARSSLNFWLTGSLMSLYLLSLLFRGFAVATSFVDLQGLHFKSFGIWTALQRLEAKKGWHRWQPRGYKSSLMPVIIFWGGKFLSRAFACLQSFTCWQECRYDLKCCTNHSPRWLLFSISSLRLGYKIWPNKLNTKFIWW